MRVLWLHCGSDDHLYGLYEQGHNRCGDGMPRWIFSMLLADSSTMPRPIAAERENFQHARDEASALVARTSPTMHSFSVNTKEFISPQLKQVDGLDVIKLSAAEDEEITSGNSTLTKRTPPEYCSQTVNTGNCINLGTLAATVANVISANIIAASKNNDCSAHTGSVDNVTWKVYATGAHCDTTAQLGTIDGAIRKYLRSQNDQICGVRCIKLDHSGSYNGYVTLAPAGQNPSDYYCGSAYSFGNCGKGGVNNQ